MARSWIIGASPDCDLVVDLPTVSGRHCRLTLADHGIYLLEDLGSTNGTFVNGGRLSGSTEVSRGDVVTLGQAVPLPWPIVDAAQATVLRIGREPDNEVVVNLPTVSGYHARIVWEGRPGEALLEDLGSSNGTAIGEPGRKITQAVLSANDTIYLGSHPLAAAPLLARFAPLPDGAAVGPNPGESTPPASEDVARRVALAIQVPPPVVDGGPESMGPTPAAGPSTAGLPDALEPYLAACRRPWILAGLLVQAPLLAFAIVLILKPGQGDSPLSNHIAPALFWLGLAAVWFGLSNATLGIGRGRDGAVGGEGAGLIDRLLPTTTVYGVLCLFQCVLAWAVVAGGSGLKGQGLAALGLLVLAALVGLLAGLTIQLAAPRPLLAWCVLPIALGALWVFGGESWPLPRMPSWARVVSGVIPSRWAFEGLMVLEADRRRPEHSAPGTDADLAEPYFPARTERMGAPADALALASMLVGIAATATFVATEPKRRP